jgi:hypothetical protein
MSGLARRLSGPARRLSGSPGALYFQEKKLQAALEERLGVWRRALADQLAAELDGVAVDARPLKPRASRTNSATACPACLKVKSCAWRARPAA